MNNNRNKLGLAAINIARAEMKAGAREIGGNNKGRFVAKYLSPAGLHPPQAWCAAFVSWCLQQARRKLEVGPALPYMVSARNLFLAARAAGLALTEPEPGCLIFWKRALPWQGHVGFVTAVEDGSIETIEGNRGPRVQTYRYQLRALTRLLGFSLVK